MKSRGPENIVLSLLPNAVVPIPERTLEANEEEEEEVEVEEGDAEEEDDDANAQVVVLASPSSSQSSFLSNFLWCIMSGFLLLL